MERVAGQCPMGCGDTLFLGEGGHVTCSSDRCPDPAKVDDILHDGESEHIVLIETERFHVQHPLRERDQELFDCGLHRWLSDLPGPPRKPGRYRARPRPSANGGGWSFEALAEPEGEQR
jgi:hypothetical protein